MTYQRIVAVVDLEGVADGVLARAGQLLRAQGGELWVVTVVPDWRAFYRGAQSALYQQFDRDVKARARERLATLCHQANVRPAHLDVLRGDPDQAIASELLDLKAELVVFSNFDRHGLDHFVGGAGLGLLHRAHCDLLAVGTAHARRLYARPLVAVNLDGHQPQVLNRARTLCPRSALAVIHVIKQLWGEYNLENLLRPFLGDAREGLEKRVRDALDPYLDTVAPAAMDLAFGTPSEEIARAARGSHDLIVIGSGQHHGLGWRLGSTAHNVLSKTDLDVLVVRPDRDDES